MAKLRFRTPPSAGQRLNELVAKNALQRGEGVAHHLPIEVYLQVASACNLDCYMCSEHLRPPEWRHGRGLVSLSTELFDRIVDEVFPFSSRITIGLGGEPMISPNFLHYVERAHAAGQQISLTTNGTRINRDLEAETLARCVSFIQMSIDGATKETYERIRLGSHWSKIRANLLLLNKYRMQYPPKQRTHLSFFFVLMKSNVHELPAMVRLAHEFHADRLHAQHVIPVTEEGKAESLIEEPDRYDRYLAETLQEGRRLGIDLDLPKAYREKAARKTAARDAAASDLGFLEASPDSSARKAADSASASNGAHPPRPPAKRIPCHMPTMTVYIFYDGRVFPCCHPFAHKKMPMGDLRTQSFAEIWNGVRYRNLRAGLFSGDAPSICRSCSIANDPPPEYEDPDALDAQGEDIDTYYAGRELAPLPPSQRPEPFLETLVRTGLVDKFADMETHISHLERNLRLIGVLPLYRAACAVKDRLVRRRAR
jgi:radical SAM protein with 4Fe4S-binding SPASM domain